MTNDIRYHKKRDNNANQRTKRLLREMPAFASEYARGIESSTSALTRYEYILNIRIFLNFMCEELPEHINKQVSAIIPSDIENLTATNIEHYLSYLSYYVPAGSTVAVENNNRSKQRKLSSLRSMLKYLVRKGVIKNDASAIIESPKIPEIAIIKLEPNELADLVDNVESATGSTAHQESYLKKTSVRDLAIITLLVGTGIRVSELVGLNIADIDFNNASFRILRKGGSEAILYLSEEIQELLSDYVSERKLVEAVEGNDSALFLSMQRKRISVRAVQNLVKKYSRESVPLKNITPHKLRSTFGTMLYQETGDIYLVADVLGHKDVNTTKKHYSAQSEQNRRMAAKVIKIR